MNSLKARAAARKKRMEVADAVSRWNVDTSAAASWLARRASAARSIKTNIMRSRQALRARWNVGSQGEDTFIVHIKSSRPVLQFSLVGYSPSCQHDALNINKIKGANNVKITGGRDTLTPYYSQKVPTSRTVSRQE